MNLVERVKGIILTPKTEWPIIAGEPGDVGTLFGGYVAILAAIPAVCGFIGWTLLGLPIGLGLVRAVFGYILTFIIVYVMALIIDALAATFGSQKNSSNSLKLAVYSCTPYWLAGIFLLIRGLSFLVIIGLVYGWYLLWLGLPPLMKTPPDKTIVYAIAIIICSLIIAIVIGLLVGGLIGVRAFM
jgi:hypothetical protein